MIWTAFTTRSRFVSRNYEDETVRMSIFPELIQSETAPRLAPGLVPCAELWL
jgi:hypothetical protein